MEPWLYYLLFGIFFVVMMRFGCGSHVMGSHGRHRHVSGREAGTPTPDPSGETSEPAHEFSPRASNLTPGIQVVPPRTPLSRER